MPMSVAPNLPKTAPWIVVSSTALVTLAALLNACSSEPSSIPGGSGGATATVGGTTGNPSTGGTTNTGNPSGGATQSPSSGGSPATGGNVSNGGSNATGGATTGGTVSNGGTSIGGAATGGAVSKGGTSTGGAATGGTVSKGGTSTGGAATGGVASAGGSTHTGMWNIMPLGDSITASTCYPQLVSKNIIAAGHTNFKFVGTTLNNQGCSATAIQTEGHGGYLVSYLQTDSPATTGKGTLAELKTWATAKPDAVFMHFGTNDAWNGVSAANIITAYTNVLTQFRSQNPSVIFIVAQIIPMNVTSATCSGCTCPNCPTIIQALNTQIVSWASSNSTTASPIYVADLNSGFTADTTNTADGVHPNTAGSQKMADKMSPAIIANLAGI